MILQYFHDKAAAKEIDYLSVSCPYERCKWSGDYCHFQVSELLHQLPASYVACYVISKKGSKAYSCIASLAIAIAKC